MSIVKIDASILLEMFANGYRNLCRKEAQVNDLNVFPVPDGDTGSNMAKTLSGGVYAPMQEEDDISSSMKKFSKAVLLSARGNSGVILSQFIKGLSIASDGKSVLVPSDITPFLKQGVDSAYKAVANPVEGTMLTVLRETYEACENTSDFSDFESGFTYLLEEMQKSLRHTPELLPVLKEAGVVDSGGMGIIYIFEGMLAYLNGEIIETDSEREDLIITPASDTFGPDSVLEYGYCTEFILQLMHAKTNIATFSIGNMISYLESVGDSIVAVQDDDIVKVHVHTFTPEKVLAFARNYGEFISVKIENMSVQHNEITQNAPKTAEKVKYAVVAVASGDGLASYFSEIGATRIVDGGQTQNPSTQDFLDAFKTLNAEYIVVLPNNSNILLAAQQAADLYTDADVRVIPTKSMAAGYSALSMMNTWADNIDTFIEDMSMCLDSVASGSVTAAIHDACINGVEIKTGAYMGIADGEILCTCDNNVGAAISMLELLPDIDTKEVITIFYGEGITEETANNLVARINEQFPYIECGALYGGQKVYDFYMAIE